MKTSAKYQKYRFLLIILPIIISLAMILPLGRAKINTNLMSYLPDNIDSKINLERIEDVFGKYEPVVIMLESDDVLSENSLARLSCLNSMLEQSQAIDDVISLFQVKYIRNVEGEMLVDPAIPYIPIDQEELRVLKESITDNSLAYGLLVSKDFKHTILVVNPVLGTPDADLTNEIKSIIENCPGEDKVYINGLPYLRHEVQSIAMRDLTILFPLGLIVMLVFLYLMFKERRAVILPFSIVIMSTALAMGLMPLLGYDLSLIAVLVPIMMIAIASNYGVHLVARYQELNANNPTWNMHRIVGESVERLSKPIILTGLTTIFGVMGLMVHILIPAKQMGTVTSLGILFALILSLTFIPAVMVGMSKGKTKLNLTPNRTTWIEHLLIKSAKISVAKPRLIILIFSAFTLIGGLGITRLNVSINLEQMMPKSHPLRVSTDIANTQFSGTKSMSVLFEGDILSPQVLQSMEKFEKDVKHIQNDANVTSLSTIIKIISRSLNESTDSLYDAIPNSRSTIAQYIEIYNLSGDPEDFEKLVNFDFSKALLNVQFKAKDIFEFKEMLNGIEKLQKANDYATLHAGQCLVEYEISRSIVKGQFYSLIFALITIAILLLIIFRSLNAGLLGIIPLVATLICNFGLMGWFGLELDIGNSLLSSIAIGLGIDYTIHLFWRLRYEIGQGNDIENSIKTSLRTTGRGIAINALSVMVGFAVLFFSGLVILKTFAFLIIFSLLLCLLCAVILMPAICFILKPSFLKHSNGVSGNLYGN